MKKLFVLVFAMILAFGLNAQKIGVKAGYGLSGYVLNFDSPDGSKMGMGFNAGVVGMLDLKVLELRADLGLVQMGSDFDKDGVSSTTDINYFQFGLSAKKGLGPVYVFAGPYLGYALSGKTNWDDGSTTGDFDVFSDDNEFGDGDFYNTIDYGLYGGFGFSMAGFFAEVSAGYGLNNFYNKDNELYKGLKEDLVIVEALVELANSLGADEKVGDYWPFMDGTTPVDEPKMNNFYIALSVGYSFGF